MGIRRNRRGKLIVEVYDPAPPRHGGLGAIYVPKPTVEVVQRLPRRYDDDLTFQTKRGRQFRRES
jgi:hypothetical protein